MNPGKLQGNVFIITGATSGMGRAMAERFAAEGAALVVNGRDVARGQALVLAIKAYNENIVFVAGDVAQPELNQTLVETALSTFGSLDGVVTNAGVLGLGSVTDVDLDTWHDTFATNLHSVFYLSKYAFPMMLETGRGTMLVNASIAAFKAFPNHPAYCASKAALLALVRQMALDYGPQIRANAICPGPVDTPLIWDSAKAFAQPTEAVQQAGAATLLKRLGSPTDVANLALFLVSDEAAWITGTAVTIDGGVMAAR